MTAALLVLLLAAFAVNTWLNVGRFQKLKSQTGDVDRLGFYKGGLVKSLILFLGGAVIGLIILGRLDAVAIIPAEFGAESLRSVLSAFSPALVYGVIWTWVAVVCLASLLGGAQMARMIRAGEALPNGALAALLPKTSGERFWASLIALNAGLSEELFFRLVLPLLLYAVTGQAVLAFVLAVVIFGLGHAYQGLWGIIMTGLVGLMLGLVYLYSGNLWLAVGIHAGIDLWSLILMPLLVGWKPK